MTTEDRTILIDPGIALGYLRHGLLPHPFQVLAGAIIRKKIVSALAGATDVVFSHFHGDHVPLEHANPYQLSMQSVAGLLKGPRIWGPGPENLQGEMRRRRDAICLACGRDIPVSEGLSNGPFRFSGPMPHGESGGVLGTVMMTRIEEDGFVFVHASDIQLLEGLPIRQILDWEPDVVLASGPPLYLAGLHKSFWEKALENALCMSEKVKTIILDHHLLRSRQGIRWLDELNARSMNSIICAADFMGEKRRFLEAWRNDLYKELPVPEGWHDEYKKGRAGTEEFQRWRHWDLKEIMYEEGSGRA